MKILLTGNKGFVGSHVESAFEADGHEVVGLEATNTFQQWCNDHEYPAPKVSFHRS